MTQTSYALRASAGVHLLAAQLALVDDPEAQPLMRVLDEVRVELQRPTLRIIDGGRSAAD